jgi:hypothetical protein
MAYQIPPIPNNPITDVFVWRDWFYKVSQALVQQASIAWTSIDFTGSNLQDIQTRQHNALQNLQGGIASQYYHLSQAQYNSLSALASIPITPVNGGTGVAGTLTGYVYANGLSPMTASTTIPWSVITGAPSITSPSYGSFSNTANQYASANNTPTVVALNTTDVANNTSLASNKITISTTGKYNIQFSLQFANTDSQAHGIWVWLRKNGTDLAGTGSRYDGPSSHGSSDGYLLAVANFFVSATAGDYIEVVFASDQVYIASPLQQGVYIEAYTSSTSPFTRPSIPSSVVTVSQVA